MGSGKDRLVTKPMYPKIVRFRKKWSKYSTLAITNLFVKVLSETSQLSLIMENDSMLIYQIFDAVRNTRENLKDLVDEKEDVLPQNIAIISQDRDNDTMKIKVSAANATFKEMTRLGNTPIDDRDKELKRKITVIHEEFTLTKVQSGQQKVDLLQTNFIPVIQDAISSRFESVLKDNVYKAFKVFDTTEWCDGNAAAEIAEIDGERLDCLIKRFEIPLSYNKFDAKECKKEWK